VLQCAVTEFVKKIHVGVTDDEIRKKIGSKLNIAQKKKAPKEAEDVHETTV